MDLLSIAAGVAQVIPDGATARSMQIELAPAQSLMNRGFHLALAGVGYDPSQAGVTAGFFVDVDFFKASAKLQTVRFAPVNDVAAFDDPKLAGRFPMPASVVLKTDPSWGSWDTTDIALLSGRSPTLSNDCLQWPLGGYAESVTGTVGLLVTTAPLNFKADIDRVVVRTVPSASSWIPYAVATTPEPRIFLCAAIVSKPI